MSDPVYLLAGVRRTYESREVLAIDRLTVSAGEILAIVGPSGAGKGTVARRLARSLGWHLLDSGALYRLTALAAWRRGVPTDAGEALVDALARLFSTATPIGEQQIDEATLRTWVQRFDAMGLNIMVHAIGEMSNRHVLDAVEAARKANGKGPRHHMANAFYVNPADIPRFAELGIVASMQPTHATSDMNMAEDRVGPQRIEGGYAWRRMLDAGVVIASGSDFPVELPNPFLGLYAAVTRQDLEGWPPGGWYPEETLTREEAVRGFTLDAAYSGFMENEVGSLERGKRADFIVLDRDIMQIPSAEILQVKVTETWLDGQRVFTR